MANSKSAYLRSGSNRKSVLANLKPTVVAVVSLLCSTNLAALGLGVMEVRSSLDQPLDGIIEMMVSDGDDLSSVKAYIAPRDDFEKLNIEYPGYLNDLSLSIEKFEGRNILRVSSNEVLVKEPFIHFLVRVDWAGGSALREYTALIDPPVYAAETTDSPLELYQTGSDQSSTTSTSTLLAEDIVFDEEIEEVEEEPDSDEAVFSDSIDQQTATDDIDDESIYSDTGTADGENDQEFDEEGSPGETLTDAQYGPVAYGESLSVIAAELQQQFPDLSVYQIMQVLFEENRDSFINENINGLLAGAVLNINDLNAIRAVDVVQARQFFYDQVSEWDPASLIASSSDDSGLRVGQDEYVYDDDLSDYSAETTTSALPSDNFQVGSSTDTQSYVSAAQGDNRDGEVLALQQQIDDLQGSLSSSVLENQELSERISILEGQLADMNRLISLDVKNAELAAVEATLAQLNNSDNASSDDNDSIVNDIGSVTLTDDADDTGFENNANFEEDLIPLEDDVIPLEDDVIPLEDDVISEGDVVLGADDALNDDALNVAVEDAAQDSFDIGELVSDEGIKVLDLDEVETAEVATIVDTTDSVVDTTNIATNTSNDVVSPQSSTSSTQPGLLSSVRTALIDDGLWKILAGVGVILLGGIGLLVARRRRADEEFEISMLSIDTQSNERDQTGERSVADADKTPDQETSFLTVYSHSDAIVQADEVDPIAEADVYIAYGRDEEAEEVLLDGIDRNPDRIDIKQKLLNLYHKNTNVEGFERIAEEIYSQKGELAAEVWQEVSLLGKDVAPNNPLFDVSPSELRAGDLVRGSTNKAAAPAPATTSKAIDSKDQVAKVDKTADKTVKKTKGDALDVLIAAQADEIASGKAQPSSAKQQTAKPDKVQEAPEEVEPVNSGAIDFDKIDPAATDSDASASEVASDTSTQGGWQLDDVEEAVDYSLAEKEDSINLIRFHDGQSEISELDDVGIDALNLGDEHIELGSVDSDMIETDSETLTSENSSTLGDDDILDSSGHDTVSEDEDLEEDSFRVSEVSDLEIDDDLDEFRTQYELAKMFVDLGDEDGARKILDGIINGEGIDAAVLADANELLASIKA